MANSTINHDEIRKWAESKGGKPAAVDRTHQGGDVGIIRIMFPDSPQSEHQSLVEISWDEFFEQFEESQLALLYEEDSLFSKIVGREKQAGGDGGAGRRSRGGEPSSGRGHEPAPPGGSGEDADLKSREYRDEQGNVHHHTKEYMEQHGGKK